ncbi:MAG: rhodanese-like domain-containing protein [Pseudomonadota bacterium]
MSPLIDVGTLSALLGASDLKLFDASWYLPAESRNAAAEFEQAHLPGARYFDFDGALSDTASDLPHMLPDPQKFEAGLRALGICANDRVVAYDGAGVFSSPRAWWMLRAAGHDAVAVLDGGLPAWRAAGHPIETGPARPVATGDIVVAPTDHWIADSARVRAALEDQTTVVIDARPAARFEGREPEPRPGLRAGHMPGARNLPAGSLIVDGHLLPVAAVRDHFDTLASASSPLVFSCGSGVTAALLAWAATVAGRSEVSVYDGSWAEWGQPGPLPVVTGPA